jgi:hypothetical protein
MFARAALFAHIQQTLFNVETIEPSGHFSHDVASGSKSLIAVMSAARPLFHRKRKSIRDLAMSQECQKRAHAPQQTNPIRSPRRRGRATSKTDAF